MSTYAKVTGDTNRKAAIVEMLTAADDGGVRLSPTQGLVTGALTLEQIRHALAVPRSEALRLVHELVDASTITMVGVGTQATFTIPE